MSTLSFALSVVGGGADLRGETGKNKRLFRVGSGFNLPDCFFQTAHNCGGDQAWRGGFC